MHRCHVITYRSLSALVESLMMYRIGILSELVPDSVMQRRSLHWTLKGPCRYARAIDIARRVTRASNSP